MTAAQICIIDDGADYRFLLQQIFKRFLPTYSVSFFPDGQLFLYQLSKLSPLPDLVLLDRHMPDLDGHQTLLRLKEQPAYQKIPVVMMSAEASTDEINGCYEAGVNSFLRKSMDFDSMKNQMTVLCQYWLEMNLRPVEMSEMDNLVSKNNPLT